MECRLSFPVIIGSETKKNVVPCELGHHMTRWSSLPQLWPRFVCMIIYNGPIIVTF